MKTSTLLLVLLLPLSAHIEVARVEAAGIEVAGAEPAQGDIKSILEKVVAREKSLPPISMDLQTLGTYVQPGETFEVRSTMHCCRDGKRLDFSGDEFETRDGIETHRIARRALWDGHRFVEREARNPDDRARSKHYYAVGWSTRHLIDQPWTAPYMDGRIQIDLLEQVLANTHLASLALSEIIDGVACSVIIWHLGCTTCSLCVDTQHSYAVRNIRLHTEAAGDKTDVELSGVELTRIGQTDFVTRAHRVSRTTSGQKVMFSSDETATRKNIRLNPDFAKAGAFVMDQIPEGAAVYNLEIVSFLEPDPTLVWWNGRAVPTELASAYARSAANSVQRTGE